MFWISISILLISGYTFFPRLHQICGSAIGRHIRQETHQRRELIIARVNAEKKQYQERGRAQATVDEEWEKVDGSRSHSQSDVQPDLSVGKSWDGVIGFFHPFCNASGGGERVLWAAIRATQQRWPNATCIVYTGDHDIDKQQMLKRVEERFNIYLFAPTITFLYLSTRQYVLNTTWPHFTLLGQSLGSLILAHDAFTLLTPDIFIDTMGYAFALALCKFLFPEVPTAAYVHYPTISTDMLGSLDSEGDAGHGLNAGAGKGWKGKAKRLYWHLFARLYGWVGGSVDVVMTNSSWTQNHIQQLWGPSRNKRKQTFPVEVIYPPCAVEELQRKIQVTTESEKKRRPILLYIAQFRPEKNHQLILKAFASYLHSSTTTTASSHTNPNQHPNPAQLNLLLIGSVRNPADETYIYSLRLLAHELHITDSVTFLLNAPWPTILHHLSTASVGVNAMWNEHFGIGVVEYQAAGLISVVNDSGGPKFDIVVDEGEGALRGPTGYLASTEEEFAEGFGKALGLGPEQKVKMRERARRNARRFSEEVFEEKWIRQVERLVELQSRGHS